MPLQTSGLSTAYLEGDVNVFFRCLQLQTGDMVSRAFHNVSELKSNSLNPLKGLVSQQTVGHSWYALFECQTSPTHNETTYHTTS